MTIHITKEIEAAYEVYIDEEIDCDVLGTPILRRDTYPFRGNTHQGIVDFAAGFQAADRTGRCAK